MVELNCKYLVIFMGTPEFAVPSLQALMDNPRIEVVGVVTQPDKPAGRSGQLQPSPVKQLALSRQVPVWTPEKVKHNSELIAQIKTAQPDTIVVVAYGKILPQEILDIPLHGIVNVHGSLLPKYRGASPIAASILNGDKSTGITLMKMALAMDAGPIIAKSEPVTIASSDTTATLAQKLSLVGAQLLNTHLLPYLDGQIIPTAQDDSQATLVPIIKKEDGLIDWHQPAEIIERQTRAYTPWPSAYTFWQGQRLKIISGNLLAETAGQPGQLWVTEDKYPAITTSQGSLKISQIQPEGKSPMSGADWLRGYPALTGAILG